MVELAWPTRVAMVVLAPEAVRRAVDTADVENAAAAAGQRSSIFSL